MKLLIALAGALFLAGNLVADPNAAALALAKKVAAKSTQAANQTDESPQTQPPRAPSSPSVPPPDPLLQATLHNIASLRTDFDALGMAADTNAAAAQKLPLLNDLAAAANGIKPSQKSLVTLGDDLTTAVAGREKLHPQHQRLAQYVHAAFNGARLTPLQQKVVPDETQKILVAGGVPPEDATNVVNDIKTIVAETK